MRRMTSTPTMTESLSGEIAEQLRDAMIVRGITQSELARRLNVRPPAVSKMLDGSGLTIASIKRIADAIGLRVSLLISDQ